MKPDAIHPGRTYERRRPWGPIERRHVLEILARGVAPYGSGSTIPKVAPLVRYRNGSAPGNTARLRGREYTCTLATFAGWARREVPRG